MDSPKGKGWQKEGKGRGTNGLHSTVLQQGEELSSSHSLSATQLPFNVLYRKQLSTGKQKELLDA